MMKTMVCGSVQDPDWQKAKQQFGFNASPTASGQYEYADFDAERHLLNFIGHAASTHSLCWLHYQSPQQRSSIVAKLDCILDNWEAISGDAEIYTLGIYDTEYWYEARHYTKNSQGQWDLKKKYKFSILEALQW